MLADHVPTQPPYNQSIAIDTTTGDITIGIYTSDGWEDSPPEKYTIFFDINNDVSTDSFCVFWGTVMISAHFKATVTFL